MKRFATLAFLLALTVSFSQTALANPLKEIVCIDRDIYSHEYESETFKCCDDEARFKAAAEVTKYLHYWVDEKCRANDYYLSAIARVCVNFKEVSDGKCIAIGTVYFTCGCCIVERPEVKDCKYDEKACENRVDIETIGNSQKYRCCDVDDRWNTTYDTMKKTYNEAAEKCAALDCKGGFGLRGYQMDYVPVDPDDNTCGVKTTLTYSCCCKCE